MSTNVSQISQDFLDFLRFLSVQYTNGDSLMRSRLDPNAWLLAVRPKTLTAALMPILVGSAFVFYLQPVNFRWWISGLALLCAVLIQIATNFINDAKDFERGADDGKRLGPPRAAAQGLLTPGQLMRGAAFCFLAAILVSVPLVYQGGAVIFVIGILSLVFGYAYTGGPFPLAYNGLGEFFVLLFFGYVPVFGLVWLHLDASLWRQHIYELIDVGSIVGLLSVCLILINNLRDLQTDTKSNKKTFVVRVGKKVAHAVFTFCSLWPFAILLGWYFQTHQVLFLLPGVCLPLSLLLVQRVLRTPEGPLFNQYLGFSSLISVLFGGFLTLAFLFVRK